jgi:L-2-hydroxyglutarate oxidase
MDKKVKFGPTAIPVLGKEQYSIISGWSMTDLMQSLKGFNAIIKGDKHDFKKLPYEVPKLINQ